jgi:hypothetical protein
LFGGQKRPNGHTDQFLRGPSEKFAFCAVYSRHYSVPVNFVVGDRRVIVELAVDTRGGFKCFGAFSFGETGFDDDNAGYFTSLFMILRKRVRLIW